MAKPTNNLRFRGLIAVAILLLVGFSVDIGRLFFLQVIKGEEYKARAQRQHLADTSVNAERGTIYDSQMNILAQSASAWLVYVNPSVLAENENDDEDEVSEKLRLTEGSVRGLCDILGVKEESVRKALGQTDYNYVRILGGVEYNEKVALEAYRDDNELNSVIGITQDTKRYYPYGNFASTVLGFTGDGDIGRNGLELEYDEVLTGIAGRRIAAKNARQDVMDEQYETFYDAKQGTTVVTTIDNVVQYTLEKGLAQAVVDNSATNAYGIVMDVDTGAVLGMSTMPDYDLNEPDTITNEAVLESIRAIADDSERSQAYNNALNAIWRNRAISDTYEPGSVFKTITLSAALEEGVVTPDFTYTCTGSIQVADNRIGCHYRAGHGTQKLEKGLMNSCNPFFITVGQKLGSEKFYKYFEAFGFTERTGIDLPGEASPVANVTYYTGDRLGISELSSCSFGQTFQVSAIQMITAVSAIANGGYLMQPYIVGSMLDEEGNTVSTTTPTVKRQVISKSTSNTVISMMESVVSSGTGKNAYIAGYRVCGKTGTSEKLTKDGEYIASFVGFAPADNPKVAVLIIIDEPHGALNGGGAIAAPVASEVLEQTLKYYNVEPVYTDAELAKLSASAPSVTNVSVNEAKSTLQSAGFSARIVGNGDTVTMQNPSPGQTLPKNGIVILYTDEGALSTTATVPKLTGMTINEANRAAVGAGFNIRISGTSLENEVSSYKQSIDEGTTAELGTIITVYFKTSTGVSDF